MPVDHSRSLLVLLGNQLFPPEHLAPYRGATVLMVEDYGLCTYVRHHQQKIVLFLAAMRSYRDTLAKAGFDLQYHELERDAPTYESRIREALTASGASDLYHFEVEDRPMEDRIRRCAKEAGVAVHELPSPGFLCERQRFASYLEDASRPFMADFYKRERLRLGILVGSDGEPAGGRWSFDADNRKKLPASQTPPELPPAGKTDHVDAVVSLVTQEFPGHPGNAREFCWPTTREGALAWLSDFLDQRLEKFGPYEDAISTRSTTVYHSLLSPLINLGLLTPGEVLERTLQHADAHDVPLQSLEGFVRQLIGWREFVRGIYRHFDDEQRESNFWGHTRELTDHWYAANTGIPPLDDTIDTARKLGWTHHIPRLMVVANLMTLCEIRPQTAWQWFMEHYVDSSEWVMGPNVYGMGLFSDGGVFATKPYICGSNYLRKMSDYPAGDWCDIVDGLYWRFIGVHREFFAGQPRLAVMPATLDRMDSDRRQRLAAAADTFLDRCTRSAG